MDKKQFEDLIKSTRFYPGATKESYTKEDLFAQEDQLRNKFASEVGPIIEQEFNALTTKATEFETKYNSAIVANKELEDSFKVKETEFTSETNDYKTKYEDATKKLQSFELAEDKRTAGELLSGLVVKGAEYDVYNSLQSAIKEIKFDEGATLEDKQSAIKPIVEGYTEAKPYFKPLVEERRSDNKSLITKKKQQEEQEEKRDVSASRGWGYNG